jgi:tRNAThr (cytosine32-N3)-methyltransferase
VCYLLSLFLFSYTISARETRVDATLFDRPQGTRVFFFDSDDLARIFTGKSAPFPVEVTTSTAPADETSLSTPLDSPSAESLSPNPEAVTSSSSSSSSTAPPGLSQLSLDVETPSTSTPTTDSVRFPAGIQPTTPSSTPSPYFPSESSPWHPPHPLFDLVQLGVDRRLVRPLSKRLASRTHRQL